MGTEMDNEHADRDGDSVGDEHDNRPADWVAKSLSTTDSLTQSDRTNDTSPSGMASSDDEKWLDEIEAAYKTAKEVDPWSDEIDSFMRQVPHLLSLARDGLRWRKFLANLDANWETDYAIEELFDGIDLDGSEPDALASGGEQDANN